MLSWKQNAPGLSSRNTSISINELPIKWHNVMRCPRTKTFLQPSRNFWRISVDTMG